MGPVNWRRGRSVLAAIWALSPLFATILWMVLLMGALILPNLFTPFLSAENAARQLLHICQLWYVTLALVLLAGFPIIWLAGHFACQRLGNERLWLLTLVCLSFPSLFLFGLVSREDLLSRFNQARADQAQAETNFLVEAEVWISPKARPAHLPGPYSGPLTQPVTRYGIIGGDTGHQWVQVYVPNAMNFSLNQERLYNENQSIQWNLENAQRYRVRFTSNFHFVTEITPID